MSACNLTLTAYELVLKYVSNKNLMQVSLAFLHILEFI